MSHTFAHHPVLLMTGNQLFWDEGGHAEILPSSNIIARLQSGIAPLLCHQTSLFGRLGLGDAVNLPCLDILEWVSFLYPTLVAPPTVAGMAHVFRLALDVNLPESQAALLRQLAAMIQASLIARRDTDALCQLAQKMGEAGWAWAQFLPPPAEEEDADTESRFAVWQQLKNWQTAPVLPPESQLPPESDEITSALDVIIHSSARRPRPSQQQYSQAVAHIFAPRFDDDTPSPTALLEAETGTGKTLGYLVPANLYAQKNQAAVWISTYTRNLQHQIFHEGKDLTDRIVIRKGRENYLCLLNYQQLVESPGLIADRLRIGLGLVARWIQETKFGDMNGDDFPPWLEDLFGHRLAHHLADRRHGCIHNLCSHYRNCFVERVRAESRHADIVVVNHALTLNECESGNFQHNPRIGNIIFDEAHHLFAVADSFYALRFSAQEAFQLRLWLNDGAQPLVGGRQRVRRRGFWARLGTFAEREEILPLLQRISEACDFLPQDNWLSRILSGQPQNPTEQFCAALNRYVLAYSRHADPYYDLEAPLKPVPPQLTEHAAALKTHISQLLVPLVQLQQQLQKYIDTPEEQCPKDTLMRLERAGKRLALFHAQFSGWHQMLNDLTRGQLAEDSVGWLAVKRRQGHSYDFEFCRHLIDPMRIFSQNLLQNMRGVGMTSATLFSHDNQDDDSLALTIQGLTDFQPLVKKFHNDFDYAHQTRVFVVTDLKAGRKDALSHAYLQLFLTARGGSLGLFTAVRRLKEVYDDIADSLAEECINLYAQHVDRYSVPNLVEIFRHDENSCLLGTDSLRDGIDVPGMGLRQVILEKMPWPRPDILTGTRRQHFGTAYYERLARFRLKQAFGRLIRRHDDRGVFVLLDSAFPSRMKDAFPQDVEIIRAPFAETQAQIAEFL